MKRFVFYFKLAGFPEWEGKGRIYATPVTDPGRKLQELRRMGYPTHHIEGGEGWRFRHLSIWEATPVGLRPGAYLIHPDHAEILRLSEDCRFSPSETWAQLAQYAEKKYIESL